MNVKDIIDRSRGLISSLWGSELIRFFLMLLFLLLQVNFAERMFFLIYHSYLVKGLGVFEVLGALVHGLKFDMAASAMVATVPVVLYYLWLRFRKGSLLVETILLGAATSLTVLLLAGDILYFAESQRHVGYEIFNVFEEATELAGYGLSQYYKTILVQVVIGIFFLWYGRKMLLFFSKDLQRPQTGFALNRRMVLPELRFLFVVVVSVVLIRGGLQPIVMSPISATANSGSVEEAMVALNGLYNSIYSIFDSKKLEQMRFVPAINEKQKTQALREIYPSPAKTNPRGVSTKPNIVIIFLESWDAFRMRSYGGKGDNTPFFDQFRQKGLTTSEMLAGGVRTTEGIFSILCSYQNPLGRTIPYTYLEQYRYNCLPEIFEKNGYRNLFFQGTFDNTIGTGDFVRMLGFQDTYGKEDVENEKFERTFWGLHDPDLYDFVLEKIRNTEEPYLVGINTNSTHDRFVPDPKTKKNRPANKEEVMRFADSALKEFIENYSRLKGFSNTIFVLVADHATSVPSGGIDQYRIPFILYAPDFVAPDLKKVIANQRDIAPTILDLLGLPVPSSFSGRSLLGGDEEKYFSDYFTQNTLGWVEGFDLVEIPLGSSDSFRCLRYNPGNHRTEKNRCAPKHDAMRLRGIAFTDYAQSLLFTGKTSLFTEKLYNNPKKK